MNKLQYIIGTQDFKNNTVKIIDNNQEYICSMFQDKDGDIGFIHKGEMFYFRYL